MGKRKEDQRRDDSSSSSSSLDAKRRRHRHYKNWPNDGMPRDGFRDAFIELKDALLAKFSTEANFKSKIEKLKEKRKKDKNKHREDLRILKEDLRILKESHEDLKSKIQEMRKEGCAEASPQSQLSQSTTFRLVIENRLCTPIYKNEMVKTEDGGGHIKVVLYDGGSPIAPDHSLASVKVELVVIEGRFNNDKRESWSKEEFEKSIITPREGMTRLVKNGTFDLIGGSCDHQGAIIMDNSQKKEVRLGVMIAAPTEERIIEGVSNLFRVQEGKTKRSRKSGRQPSLPARILGQSTSTYLAQHEDYGPSHPPPTVPLMVQGNGQAVNGNTQNFTRQFPAQMGVQSASPYPMQHVQFGSCAQPNDFQAAVNQHLPAHGQDQSHQSSSFPNGSSELAPQNPSTFEWLNDIQSTFSPGDVCNLNATTQMQETVDWSFRCCRVLLQWDKPRVELSECWNLFDQLVPLYSTKSRFYGESFPSMSLIDKAHKLPGSISSVGSVWKMMTSVTSRAAQTPQKRGVLIRPIDSDDEPPFNKPRNAKYQLRFVNRVCSDYYTREKIKSENGTFLKVALYDENNLVVTTGPLSSASVVVVLLHGDFNAEGQDYWTHEEFIASSLNTDDIFYLGEAPLGGDCVLALTDGEADLGNMNFLISSSLARTGKFKMGIQIKYVTEESVQEGITRPFVVRVRQAEGLGRHQIRPLEQLLGVRTELANRILGPHECVATKYLGTSSALHVQSALLKNRKREVILIEDSVDDDVDSVGDDVDVVDSPITDLRSQLSQSRTFRPVMENRVSKTIYKNEMVENKDGGGPIIVAFAPVTPAGFDGFEEGW